jgi:hypothetical protein
MLPGTAQAQGVPRLATIDQPGRKAGVSLDPSMLLWTPDPGENGWGLRVGLRGEGHFSNGAGIAAEMAFSFVDIAQAGGDTTSSLSNLGLWGFWRGAAGRNSTMIWRAGMLLGTADRDARANFLMYGGRLQDFALAIPRGYGVRLGGSWLLREGRLFVRADGGADIFVDNAGSNTVAPMFHLGGAAGLDFHSVAIALEIANLLALEDDLLGDPNDLVHTLAVTASFPGSYYLSFVLPLDEGRRGNAWYIAGGFFWSG